MACANIKVLELCSCKRHSHFSLLWQYGFVLPVEEVTALPVTMQGTGKEPPWLLVGIVTLKHKRRTYKQHWKYTQTSSTNLYQSASCSPWGQYGGIIPSVSRSTGSTPWRWVCAIVTMCVCKWIGFCIIFSYYVRACNMYYKHREYWLTCAPSYTCACPLEFFHSLKNLCIDISFLEFLLSGVQWAWAFHH